MRVHVSSALCPPSYQMLTQLQDPEIQKVTGKTKPVDVMSALREMKNSM